MGNSTLQEHNVAVGFEEEADPDDAGDEGFGDPVSDIPEEAIVARPELRAAILAEELFFARKRLYFGASSEARAIFEGLLKNLEPGAEDDAMLCGLGLAACELSLGLKDKAHRSLENAARTIAAGGSTFGRGKAASILLGFYRLLKNEAAAATWEAFIEALECPQATKDVFEKKARHVLERCEKNRRLVIV